MVDALLSGGSGRKAVQVRVLSWAQQKYKNKMSIGDFRCFFLLQYDYYNYVTYLNCKQHARHYETHDRMRRTTVRLILKFTVRIYIR